VHEPLEDPKIRQSLANVDGMLEFDGVAAILFDIAIAHSLKDIGILGRGNYGGTPSLEVFRVGYR
jgi:hypothetical protein